MTFLYPSFLFGLFALAIPVIIHLFNFRRTKKIYFSNTLFLKKVKEASSSKLKTQALSRIGLSPAFCVLPGDGICTAVYSFQRGFHINFPEYNILG